MLALGCSGSDLGKLVVVEREVGDGVVVCGRDRRIVRSHRSEKLSRRLAHDEVGLRVSRALLGVGALELAVGVVVGRSVGERQGSDVVAVLGLEGDEQLVLELARLRVAREWGPRASHRDVGQGRQVREAARKVIVLLVVAGAVGLVVRAHVEHTLVGRVDGGPRERPDQDVVKRRGTHDSVGGDSLTVHVVREPDVKTHVSQLAATLCIYARGCVGGLSAPARRKGDDGLMLDGCPEGRGHGRKECP
eukprot:scaffold53661_cov63-Phaeocystis_antarctica.AAC.2